MLANSDNVKIYRIVSNYGLGIYVFVVIFTQATKLSRTSIQFELIQFQVLGLRWIVMVTT